MRVLVQRVKEASVEIEAKTIGRINKGLLLLVGIEEADNENDINYLCKKCVNLRIFDDQNGVMNRSVTEIDGEIMVVSQFTLFASTKKGNRPSYIRAAASSTAIPLYERFCETISNFLQKKITTGQFGADMQVHLINDGPVTIWMDSKNKE